MRRKSEEVLVDTSMYLRLTSGLSSAPYCIDPRCVTVRVWSAEVSPSSATAAFAKFVRKTLACTAGLCGMTVGLPAANPYS